jgi:hypothetical protein
MVIDRVIKSKKNRTTSYSLPSRSALLLRDARCVAFGLVCVWFTWRLEQYSDKVRVLGPRKPAVFMPMIAKSLIVYSRCGVDMSLALGNGRAQHRKARPSGLGVLVCFESRGTSLFVTGEYELLRAKVSSPVLAH